MVDLSVHPEALAEFMEAVAFYEARASGLGQDFFDEVHRVWRLIRENPQIAAEFEAPYRRYVCRRFPFGVVYRPTRGGVRVLAVMHTACCCAGYPLGRVSKRTSRVSSARPGSLQHQ